jgi:hypothetical protein
VAHHRFVLLISTALPYYPGGAVFIFPVNKRANNNKNGEEDENLPE